MTATDDTISMGSTVSSYVDIKMLASSIPLENHEIQIKIGLALDAEWTQYEWVSVGYFTVQKLSKDEEAATFTAYDRMMKFESAYFSDLPDTTNTVAILNEMSTKIGVPIVTSNLTGISIAKPTGEYTAREMLSYISQLHGGFAICNRDGEVEIRWYEESGYELTTKRYSQFKHNEYNYTVDKMEVSIGTEANDEGTAETIYLTAGIGTRGISFSNPFMTQTVLDSIYTKVQGFSYMPGEVKVLLGDIRLDPWDVITVYDLEGTAYKVPCMNLIREFDGGLYGSIEAYGESESEANTDFKGPNTLFQERVAADLAIYKEALIEKASIQYLEANYATITNLQATDAQIDYLKATSVTTDYLVANYATIAYLNAAYTTTAILQASYATIASLEAANANINTLQANLADINTLLAGNLTSDNIQSLHITASNTTFDNAVINNAAIASVSANKITAGTIYTNLINVQSQNGQLYIADNTIQIKDNNRARVQIGEDASGDYSMYVWDASGNLMFDALGLHESGIKSGIIKDSMVASNANISAEKLDITSLQTVVNSGNITINSSNVLLDATGQKLNVAFSTLATLAESTADDLANLSVGSRNYLLKTADPLVVSGNAGTNQCQYQYYLSCGPLANLASVGDWMAISFDWKATGSGFSGRFLPQFIDNPWGASNGLASVTYIGTTDTYSTTISSANTSGKIIIIGKVLSDSSWLTSTATKLGVRMDDVPITVTLTISNIQIEKGSVATDWSSAPEDTTNSINTITSSVQSLTTDLSVVQGQISAKIWATDITTAVTPLNTSITSLSDQYATLNATVNSISATVASHTSQINTKADSSTVTNLQSQVTNLSLGLDGFKVDVSSTYVKQVDFDALSIGGVNRALNTGTSKTGTGFTGTTNMCITMYTVKLDTFEVGDTVTVSFVFDYSGLTNTGANSSYLWFQGSGDVTVWTGGGFGSSGTLIKDNIEFGSDKSGTVKLSYSFVITSDHKKNSLWYTNIRTDYLTGGSFTVSKFSVVRGVFDVDWTPAPEDTDAAINTVSSQYTTLSQTVDSFKTTVSSTYVTKTDYSTKITTLESSITQLNNSIALKVTQGTISSLLSVETGQITIASNRFILDSTYTKISADGTITCNKLISTDATITGGTINIATSSESYSAIKLSYGSYTSQYSPIGLALTNSSTGYSMTIQSGGIWFRNSSGTIIGGMSPTAIYYGATGYSGYALSVMGSGAIRDKLLVYGNVTMSKKIQCGMVTLTPGAANTPVMKTVFFSTSFDSTPIVVATARTSQPGTQVLGVGATDVTTSSFVMYLTRTNTTSTDIFWIAVV